MNNAVVSNMLIHNALVTGSDKSVEGAICMWRDEVSRIKDELSLPDLFFVRP